MVVYAVVCQQGTAAPRYSSQRASDGHGELRVMAVNIIGLGLIVAAVILMIMGGLVAWIIGVICLIGGVGALFMTWQQRRRRTVT